MPVEIFTCSRSAALKVHDDILSRDYSGFETDLTTASAEANAVRAELGLPPVKTPNIKPGQLAMDPAVPPFGVLTGQPEDQGVDVPAGRRPPRSCRA